MYKLPVFATIRETYRFIGGQLSALVNYAMVPVIFGTVVFIFMFLSIFAQVSTQTNHPGIDLDADQIAFLSQISDLLPFGAVFALSFILVMVNFAFYILFVVAWHRRYLLGPALTSPREIFAWRGRHWRYLGNIFLVSIVAGVAMMIVSLPLTAVLGSVLGGMASSGMDQAQLILFSIVMYLVIGTPFGLVASRIIFVFPAIAVDRTGLGFGGSIKLTRRNTWRIVFIFFLGWALPYLVISLGASLLAFIPSILELSTNSISLAFIIMLLQQMVFYAIVAIGVSMLSIIYKKLVDNVPLETAPAGPSTV